MIVMFQNRKILAPTFLEYLRSNVPIVRLQKAAILQPGNHLAGIINTIMYAYIQGL